MRTGVRLPMYLVAVALLGLMAVLATLQYRWLGRISEDERDRRSAALDAQATGFAQDFDRELTRAYLLFQWEPTPDVENLAARVAGRYERWQATARFPRLIRDVYLVRADRDGDGQLQRFSPDGQMLEPVEWPESLRDLRVLTEHKLPEASDDRGAAALIRALPQPLWAQVPALVVPLPMLMFRPHPAGSEFRVTSSMSYAVLVLDRDYITSEVFPALADQHFGGSPEGADYQLAVLGGEPGDILYRSTEHFAPARDATADASSDLFHVRPQEFGGMASEIRRISTVVATPGPAPVPGDGRVVIQSLPSGGTPRTQTRFELREGTMMSVILPPGASPQDRSALVVGTTSALAARALGGTPQWRLLVQHRSGSLEAAVDATRRRNLAVSSGVLTLLAVSVGFLMLSTRRAQQLARQQMEFVAAVSHELRTPLAVIRSAGDNLAEGVVSDERQVRKYGALVRNEGRRLTEMVEQILEFAGIHSGQRAFVLRPVVVGPLVDEVIEASRTLIDEAGLQVQLDLPATLPPVLADEPALRRVLQNLVGNAIKYGAGSGALRISGSSNGREVHLAVADSGIGIASSEQQRIFEPFYRAPAVVSAQIQGAGLGLSLVKRIVESHGGRISVRSAPGAGSEFTVSLPAAMKEPIAGVADGQRVPGGAQHGSHA
jgi:signal transduction histidine kinase